MCDLVVSRRVRIRIVTVVVISLTGTAFIREVLFPAAQ